MEMLSFMVVLPISFSVNKHSKYNDYFTKIRRIFDLELVALQKGQESPLARPVPRLDSQPCESKVLG